MSFSEILKEIVQLARKGDIIKLQEKLIEFQQNVIELQQRQNELHEEIIELWERAKKFEYDHVSAKKQIQELKVDKVESDELDFHIPKPKISEKRIDLRELVENFEIQLIIQALRRTDWVKNQAAKILGINRTTLVEKIKKYGIEENKNLFTNLIDMNE